MAAIRCRIFRQAELSGPLGHRRVSLTPNHAEVVMNPCFHTVCEIYARGKSLELIGNFLQISLFGGRVDYSAATTRPTGPERSSPRA
jgi:hypothetical protein